MEAARRGDIDAQRADLNLNKMETLTFNHHFEKLGFIGGDVGRFQLNKGYALLLWFMRSGPEKAVLISVSEVLIARLPKEFVDYDTKYVKHPKSKVMDIPRFFPTLRRFTLARKKDYESKIGSEFRVEIDELFK